MTGSAYFTHPNGHADFQASVPSEDPNEDGKADEPPVFMADAAGTMSEREIADLTVEANRLLYEGLDAMVLAKDMHVLNGLRNADYEPGQFGAKMTEALYEWNRGAGIPFPDPDPVALARWGGVFFMFPNFFILPDFGNALMYRFRPDSRRSRVVLLRALVEHAVPGGSGAGKAEVRRGPPEGRRDRVAAHPAVRTSAISSASSGDCIRKVCRACGRPSSSRMPFPTCTRISTGISREKRCRRKRSSRMTTSAPPEDVQRRLYELMALMKTADDRLSKGIGTGEFVCRYWPSRGQEAIAAAIRCRARVPTTSWSRRTAVCTT